MANGNEYVLEPYPKEKKKSSKSKYVLGEITPLLPVKLMIVKNYRYSYIKIIYIFV